VIGAFFYVSGQDIDALIRVIMAIYNFFKQGGKPVAAFAQPSGLEVTYGSDNFASFKALGRAVEGGVPSKVVVKWSMPAGPGPTGAFKVPVP
jgi:hypothetical protein